MNQEPTQVPTPDTNISPQTPLTDQPAPPESGVVLPPAGTETGQPKQTHKTKYVILGILILLGATSALAYYLSQNQKPATPAVAQQSVQKLALPNQPKQMNDQFGIQNFAYGYVDYKAASFQTVDKAFPDVKALAVQASSGTEKQVLFMSDLSYKGTDNSRRLLMYDVASKKTYVITEDKSVGSYDNPKIMSNHYVVYAVTNQTDPVTSTTAIKSTDLNTGKTITIMSDKSANLPASLCCSVSDDGLRMVIPQNGKFLIYQAGETKPVSFSSAVKVFPATAGKDNDDYAASQRNYGYPAIVWIDTNRFMYAKNHPLQWKVDAQGSHPLTDTNGLAVYDLTTSRSTDVARTSDKSIKWFTVDGDSIVFAAYKSNVGGVTDSNSGLVVFKLDNFKAADSQPLELLDVSPDFQSFLFYDQTSKKLYVQPSGGDSSVDKKVMQVLDTATGKSASKKIGQYKYPEVKGVIGPDQLIVDDSYSVNNDYYIYSPVTDSSLAILSATSN